MDLAPAVSFPSQSLRFPPSGFMLYGLGGAFFAFLLLSLFGVLLFFFRFRRCKAIADQAPSAIKLQRFCYKELYAATNGFNNDLKLGRGGFGTVYKGVLRSGQEVAIKKLDETSLQGEYEFQNELHALGNLTSTHIVGLLGFCIDGTNRLLVSEYMQHGSLQEALFSKSLPFKLDWNKRFRIVLDVAKALSFLHTKCEPAIIHGDIKPSNILLDSDFSARMADFGLARLKTDIWLCVKSEDVERQLEEKEKGKFERKATQDKKRQKKDRKLDGLEKEDVCIVFDSYAFNTDSFPAKETIGPACYGFEQAIQQFELDQDVRSFEFEQQAIQLGDDGCKELKKPQLENLNPFQSVVFEVCKRQKNLHGLHVMHSSTFDYLESRIDTDNFKGEKELEVSQNANISLDNKKQMGLSSLHSNLNKGLVLGREEWWEQENKGTLSFKYILEWIGNADSTGVELSSNWSCRKNDSNREGATKWEEMLKDQARKSEWQVNLNYDFPYEQSKNEKGHKPETIQFREWWKEGSPDLCRNGNLELCQRDDNGSEYCKNSNHNNSKNSKWTRRPEIFRGNNKPGGSLSRSTDYCSGDLLSRGVSSTPSTRGTVCYVAPECRGEGMVSEKSDVYSFGVLLLVIISGRRPLQVVDSPLTEMDRGNLISWAKRLAQAGNVLELLDATLLEYNHAQAKLCVKVALLCLRRSPASRPDMNEVVKILSAEREIPYL